MSTRVSGHYLFHEGAAFESVPRSDPKSYLDASLHWVGQGRRRHAVRRVRSNGVTGRGFAVCGGCGEHSPILDTAAQRRRWAGEHKAKMSGRSLLPVPKTGKAFATEYTISALPDPGCQACSVGHEWTLLIRYSSRHPGLWYVLDRLGHRLGRDGTWSDPWSDRHDHTRAAWDEMHLYPIDDAIRLAKAAAPKMTVMDRTVKQATRIHNKHHTQEPPA